MIIRWDFKLSLYIVIGWAIVVVLEWDECILYLEQMCILEDWSVDCSGLMVNTPKICFYILIPGTCKCDLIWKNILAEIIKLRVLRWYHPGIFMLVLKIYWQASLKKTHKGKIHRKEKLLWTWRKSWEKQSLAQECQEPPEPERGKEWNLPSSLWNNHRPAGTLILEILPL